MDSDGSSDDDKKSIKKALASITFWSRLLKRKVWSGTKTGGTHILASGSVGNSSEPKRIVSLEPVMPKMAERWAIQ